jgi:hypothetical protein
VFVAVISHLGGDRTEAMNRMRTVSDQIRTAIAEPYQIPMPSPGTAEREVVHHCTASIGVDVEG